MGFAELPIELRLRILQLIGLDSATHLLTFTGSPLRDLVSFASSDPALFLVYKAYRSELVGRALLSELRGVPWEWMAALITIDNATYTPSSSTEDARFGPISEYDASKIIKRVLKGPEGYQRRPGDLRALRVIAHAVQPHFTLDRLAPHAERAGIFYFSIPRHCRPKWIDPDIPAPGPDLKDALNELLGLEDEEPDDTTDVRFTFEPEILECVTRHCGENWDVLEDEFLDLRCPAYWFNFVLHGGGETVDEERLKAVIEQYPIDWGL